MTIVRPARGLAAVALGALGLAACAVGPRAPDVILPPSASGAFLGTAIAPVVEGTARDDWWRLYEDPTLDRLVLQALAENKDIAAAAANLRAVRATLKETRGGRLPTLTGTAGATYSRQSAGGLPPGSGVPGGVQDELETYDAGLDASYEIDLWGRISAAIRAAGADGDAAEAAWDVVRVTVAAETARAYADVCSSNAQISVAERTIALQVGTADLTQRLLDAGAGNGLDAAAARSSLESSRAALPPLRAQRDGAVFRLATLTGDTPAQSGQVATTCLGPPRLTQPIPVGDGAQMLARRPDVRQAERQVRAAAARINLAVANLYPRVTLGASAGATALDLADLGEEENFRFSLGPLISWSFTNPAVGSARIARADALTDQALANFDKVVLEALQEAETALSSYANELDRRRALAAARDQAATAARLSRLRFDAGADSFFVVLDAERTLAGLDAQLAQSEAQVHTSQIAVFKALAGGWSGG